MPSTFTPSRPPMRASPGVIDSVGGASSPSTPKYVPFHGPLPIATSVPDAPSTPPPIEPTLPLEEKSPLGTGTFAACANPPSRHEAPAIVAAGSAVPRRRRWSGVWRIFMVRLPSLRRGRRRRWDVNDAKDASHRREVSYTFDSSGVAAFATDEAFSLGRAAPRDDLHVLAGPRRAFFHFG